MVQTSNKMVMVMVIPVMINDPCSLLLLAVAQC